MNEQEFWRIVAEVNRLARYQRYRAEELTNHLGNLSREHIVDFYIHFNRFINQAHIGDVYGAGSLLGQHYMSDDGFEYFRYWLISMGQNAYQQALINPDSMAQLELTHDREGYPRVYDESYCYAIYDAYEKVTGEKIHKEAKVQESWLHLPERADFNWMDYNHVTLAEKFPLLWATYLANNLDHDAARKRFTINSEGISGDD
ncbi:DUF4240 domain-containing protein [Undibacterium sp. TS12]|uniref:DUF4240 domain-containing protein n=1 Tax=Undibacterium sp. TS12 TaxID=2908202 RepID=UPI001F4C5918|nr:DUF4240 domain-containing protein [Undibacterium sp. TS12]MCH8622819.1 DUF4240 domain-containing protein [Undibacterium sp. TS12]